MLMPDLSVVPPDLLGWLVWCLGLVLMLPLCALIVATIIEPPTREDLGIWWGLFAATLCLWLIGGLLVVLA